MDYGEDCTTQNILKTIKLYTLNGVLWFVNYISRKLFIRKLDAIWIERKETKEHSVQHLGPPESTEWHLSHLAAMGVLGVWSWRE